MQKEYALFLLTLSDEFVVLPFDSERFQTRLASERGPDVLVVESTNLVPFATTFYAGDKRLRLHFVVDQLLKVCFVYVTVKTIEKYIWLKYSYF